MDKIRMWLDDDRDPADPAVKKTFGLMGNEVWVRSVVEAIDLLGGGLVEWMSLGETGLDAAVWVEDRAFLEKLSRVEWRVHSQDVVTAENMKRALKKADRYWGVR